MEQEQIGNQAKIRNFVILAHIDHGKSTLADRFLELTGTVDKRKMCSQYLDMMDLEREKGITIKMKPVRMRFKDYVLNLIDTPGHVDFNYEVSRSLAVVEGAILLVDATKGIQAQTIGNLELAKKQNLVIIPVVNKIDLSNARIGKTCEELAQLLNINKAEIIKISAKYGKNIEQVLDAVIKKISPPRTILGKARALIFDSQYDVYKGVIAYVRVFDGKIKKGEKIYLIQGDAEGEAKEVGIFKPELIETQELQFGEIGYIATGIKEPGKVRVGDTIIKSKISPPHQNLVWGQKSKIIEVGPLPGYKEPKPMVFISIYPENSNDFALLKKSLEKLKLNDAALVFKPELRDYNPPTTSSHSLLRSEWAPGLGRGFQCGFLGLLHAEITTERLKREFSLSLILSTPSVIYKILTTSDQEFLIYTPKDWPDTSKIKESQELWVRLQVLTPLNYLGKILELLETIEFRHLKTDYLGTEKAELVYEVPLREVITKNFYNKLKGASQGFASMNYEILGWRQVYLVKLDILILGKKEEVFSRIVPQKDAYKEGKKTVKALKEVLPPQLFSVSLQAAVGGKIVARETIKARRRDVLAPLYGGDYTRKRKLLERQKKGKKELKEKGRIRIPPEVYFKILS